MPVSTPVCPASLGRQLTAYNEEGLNDLLVLEVPAEFNFDLPKTPLGALHGPSVWRLRL